MKKVDLHSRDEIPSHEEIRAFSESIGIHAEGLGDTAKLSFGGNPLIPSDITSESFLQKITTHPKCPNLSDKNGKKRFYKAFHLLENFPFKKRKSGEAYDMHLMRSAFYYLEMCPSPTWDGLVRSLHHDSYEDFPRKRYKLQRVLGMTNLRAVVGLAKMNPDILLLAQKTGKFPIITDTHTAVRNALREKAGALAVLEMETSYMRMIFNSFYYLNPFFQKLIHSMEESFMRMEGKVIDSRVNDPELLLQLGVLYQEIHMSGDEEDLYEELALIVNLLHNADTDDLYVKIGADRIDNLSDIRFLKDAIDACKTIDDCERVQKSFNGSYKMLATSRMYTYIAKTILKDAKLVALLQRLMAWNEQTLSELRKKLNQKKTIIENSL